MYLDDGSLLSIDNLQFATYVALDVWFLDIIARVDGLEERVEECSEVAFVECSYGIAIFAVGLSLLQGLVYQLLIVVLIGKSHHLGSYEDITLAQGLL